MFVFAYSVDPRLTVHLGFHYLPKYVIRSHQHTNTPDRRQSKTLVEFSIVICRQVGDIWQAKTLYLAIFDPRSSIVKSVFDCHLSGVTKG